MKKILACLLVLACSTTLFAGGKQEKDYSSIKVATNATWPPMEFVNEDQKMVGFDIDLIKAVGEKAGIEVEIMDTAWDGIFAGLANGDYDAVISAVTITEDRKKKMDFSEPYVNAGQVLVLPNELKGITSLEEMDGKSIGAQIGTTGAIEVSKYKDIDLKTYDEVGLAFADMANGRVEGVVVDSPTAASYALQSEKYKDSMHIAGEPFTGEFYGIVFQKGNQILQKKVNAALAELKKDGTIEKLEDKWLY